MKTADDSATLSEGPTRREVLKAGVAVAAVTILPALKAEAVAADTEPRPRIRIKTLRREDLRPDPDLAG